MTQKDEVRDRIKIMIMGWNKMVIKNLQGTISECITYADEISQSDIYPADAKMALRDLLRYDMVTFLGYLYEQDNPCLEDQIQFIKTNLHMSLSGEKFVQFVNQQCRIPRFFQAVPESIDYFIKYDLMNVGEGDRTIAKSKFVVKCFQKLGEGFIAYDKCHEETKNNLAQYIEMLNKTLEETGVVTHQEEHALKMSGKLTESGKPKVAEFVNSTVPDEIQHSEFDAATGRFTTKKAVSVSGYNIMKKRADDISEFQNFIRQDEEEEDKVFKRGGSRVGGNRRGDDSEDYEKSLDELIQELDGLIGLGTVKLDVKHLVNIIKVRKLREMKGLRRIDMSFHLVFTGNPGTGKTTIARLLAKIYKQLGVVSKGHFIEVDRSGLVDHFSGGTAIKTTEVINRAIGGILFIDEAYALTNKKDVGDYGQEAVDTLLKRMEDDRDDLIVIVAGYTEPMRQFIESNPGLKSRFNKYINFPDYTATELMEVFKLMCKETDYVLTDSAAYIAETYLRGIAEGKNENFANARLVRNYFERCVDRQATRIVQDDNIDEDDLVTFVREDMIEEGSVNLLQSPDAK